jgi:signal transduction histidine kinase
MVTVQYATFGLILVALGAGLVSVNTLVFLRLFARMPEQRLPVTLMLTADLASRSLYVLGIYRSANNAYASTLTVLALCLTWSIYAIVVFGFRILDPLGAARLTVLRQMREGMIVFDNDWRVVSVNRAAEGVLGAPASQFRGRNWQRVLPDVRPPAAPAEEMPVGEVWLPALVANRDKARCYALNLSPLYDQRELRAGSLLLLLDITAQRRAQAQAQEQQRTLAVLSERERLARELHDDLAQVLAFVNAQGQATRLLLNQGDVQAADEHLARLIEVAQEADADLREAILGLRVPLPDAGFLPALRAYLRQYEKRFGISTELVTPAPIRDQAFDPLTEAQLLRIIQEALTNARKHAHARAVKVTISAHDGLARLVIMDDGSGFRPADEAANGCDHVGLRVMRERAEEVGGSLEVRSTVGRGTEVIVTAPARLSRAGGPEGGHGAVAAC